MRVMVLVKATADTEAGVLPTQAELEAMTRYNEELLRAGVLLGGEGLQPSARGVRVSLYEGRASVVDGPFVEARELVAGFWLWQVRSREEAIEWARRIPHVGALPFVVEIRPLFEAEDFGEALTPELRAREARMAGALAAED